MQFEPMIKVRLKEYQRSYGMENKDENTAFEYFVNHTILRSHQPESFDVINDVCDLICVDGENDMGIDGIAIKVNDFFVSSVDDVDHFVETYKKIRIEFVFIQSKYKDKFDTGEYGKFVDGVIDFLQVNHNEPHNDKIKDWLKIKDYLMSEEIMASWSDVPNIRTYYVVMGNWTNNEHIIAKTENMKHQINAMKSYGEIVSRYIDSKSLLTMCEENDNNFTTTINTLDSFQLTEVLDVENSLIMLCSGTEIIKMLKSSDELLRKSLFDDNVRDFQGDTTINGEMLDTIRHNPQQFVLMNNGITIVCHKAISSNRKVTITNPQVVNGCQTCNVLYLAHKKGIKLEDIYITVKVISTKKNDVTNQIVRGTNRQNIVLDEAFEITREFHKNLENFFLSLPLDNSYEKIYYERRSKQYANNPMILATQKINFRILIQSVVSLFLEKPNNGSTHEAKLLQEYQNILFVDNQSLYPYYTAPSLLLFLDSICREHEEKKFCTTYKYQLLLILAVLIAGFPPDINKIKPVDAYCNTIIQSFSDLPNMKKRINEAIEKFKKIIDDWVSLKGESHFYGIKNNPDFNEFLIVSLHKRISNLNEKNEGVLDKERTYRGTVIKVLYDRNNQYYGFISRMPENIFFHANENEGIDFSKLYAKDVMYKIKIDYKGIEKAIITKIVKR